MVWVLQPNAASTNPRAAAGSGVLNSNHPGAPCTLRMSRAGSSSKLSVISRVKVAIGALPSWLFER